MSCVVAIVENGMVYFASDSLSVNIAGCSYSKVSQAVQGEISHIWVRGDMVFGGHGDDRMLQLAHYKHTVPDYSPGQNKVEYLVKEFIPSLQACFSANEFSSNVIDGEILLAIENQLFVISSDLQVYSLASTFYSVGQAAPIAEGSLYSTERLRRPPLQRLYLALLAAEYHSDVVSRPYLYITNTMEEPVPLDERVMQSTEDI